MVDGPSASEGAETAPGRGPLWVAKPNAHVARFFHRYTRRLFSKKFHAVRFTPGSGDLLRALNDASEPVIVAMNHCSWWDPMVGVLLASGATPDRRTFAPMELAQLEQFAFFRMLGVFGLDPEHPRAVEAMTAYILEQFGSPTSRDREGAVSPISGEDRSLTVAARSERRSPASLWLTPQGSFADVRTPAKLRPGAAAVAAAACTRFQHVRVVTLAIEYGFWTDQKPEVFLHAEPVPTPDRADSTTAWHRALTCSLRSSQSALAERVAARDPAGFELRPDLVGGRVDRERAQVNPIYDLWLRLRGQSGKVTPRDLASRAPSERSRG
ncbi:MAG: hypothetical protein EA378_06000 [Phycisphaerales bacterium]|nr:MAG: hypothetical protein EA378_06000 [Phycisphaerales bacterium]